MKKLISLMSILIGSLTTNIALTSDEESTEMPVKLIHISKADKKARDLQATQTLTKALNETRKQRLQRYNNSDTYCGPTFSYYDYINNVKTIEINPNENSVRYNDLRKDLKSATRRFLVEDFSSAKDAQSGIKVLHKIKHKTCYENCCLCCLGCCHYIISRPAYSLCKIEEDKAMKAIELMERE